MDIVEIARDPKNLCQVQGCNTAPTCLCGLIEDMADEIERLREALKPFAKIADDWDHLDDEDYVSVHKYDIELRHFRAIRSAIQQKESD